MQSMQYKYKYHFDEKSDKVLKNPEFPADKFELVKPGDIIQETDEWGNNLVNCDAGNDYCGWTPLYRPIVNKVTDKVVNKGNPFKIGLTPATVIKGKLYRHKEHLDSYYLGCNNKSLIIIKSDVNNIGNKVVSFKKNRKFWAGLYEN